MWTGLRESADLFTTTFTWQPGEWWGGWNWTLAAESQQYKAGIENINCGKCPSRAWDKLSTKFAFCGLENIFHGSGIYFFRNNWIPSNHKIQQSLFVVYKKDKSRSRLISISTIKKKKHALTPSQEGGGAYSCKSPRSRPLVIWKRSHLSVPLLEELIHVFES